MGRTTIAVSQDTKFRLMKLRAEMKLPNYEEVIKLLMEVYENARSTDE